jgi:tetratricopeptide (TPR) repeat protein
MSEALAAALDHHQAGRLNLAEQIYRQVLQAVPNQVDAIHLLGLLAHQVGRDDVAIEYIERAIVLNGNVAGFHNNLANAYHAAGRIQEALASYGRALKLDPDMADAHSNLGDALRDLGRLDEAACALHRALTLKPDLAEAHQHLGDVYSELGKMDEAIVSYRRALELNPALAAVHINLGLAFKALGRPDEAVACLRRALELKPDSAEAYCNLGSACRDQGRLDDAIAAYRRALELKPSMAEPHSNLCNALMRPAFAEAHNNLGVALNALGQPAQAEACHRRALELKPNFAEALSNLGNTLNEQGKLDEAAACYRRALALRPALADAHSNLGLALHSLGKPAEAMGCYRQALALKLGFAAARYNLGLSLLQLGQYEEGWREYEYRPEGAHAPQRFSQPLWTGERAEGRTILICNEQGYGDTIQFARYVSLVKARSGAHRVVLETQPPLARLFAQNGGFEAEIAPGRNLEEITLPPFDFHVSLLSLPLALQQFEPLQKESYLHANPELRHTWHQKLAVRSGIRVGLVWAGSPLHRQNRRRSMRAEQFQPLLQIPGLELYSLQGGPESAQGQALAEAGLIDLTAGIADFADTAAILAELDLIITVDTAIAHLAGALGRPVWLLLPFPAEWRWGMAGEATPWYPSMRLFRQPAPGDWETVVQRVESELRRLANDK